MSVPLMLSAITVLVSTRAAHHPALLLYVNPGDVRLDRENTFNQTEEQSHNTYTRAKNVTHTRGVHHQIQIMWSLAKQPRAVARHVTLYSVVLALVFGK